MLLAKRPRRGAAKRRLARDVGWERALVLARAFLADSVRLACASGADRRVIAFAPPSARAFFAAVDPGATLVAQPRGSFGARLQAALAAGLARAERAVVIGMDSPTLPPAIVRAAFRPLGRADCVIGPARDGGYYLIGAAAPLPATLFQAMPWSTPRVLAETLARARSAGLRVALLPRWYDVDSRRDLARVGRDRAGLGRARATRVALTRVGWVTAR